MAFQIALKHKLSAANYGNAKMRAYKNLTINYKRCKLLIYNIMYGLKTRWWKMTLWMATRTNQQY